MRRVSRSIAGRVALALGLLLSSVPGTLSAQTGGLDQELVGDAAGQHADFGVPGTGAEVVAGQASLAVAEHLEIPDGEPAHAGAALRPGPGAQGRRRDIPGRAILRADECRAFADQIVLERRLVGGEGGAGGGTGIGRGAGRGPPRAFRSTRWLEVRVQGTLTPRIGSGVTNPPRYQNVRYSVHISSPASTPEIDELRKAVEAVCPIYNLLKDAQPIEVRIVRERYREPQS